MQKEGFLCADIGTSSIKAALIALDGQLCTSTRVSYPAPAQLVAPTALTASTKFAAGTSLPAQAWLDAFFVAGRKLLSRIPQFKVLALAISGNGPSLVPSTAQGQDLAPLHWHEPVDSAYLGIGGPSFFLPAVSQFFDQRKEDAKKTFRFLSSQEWLSHKLGAEAFTTLPGPDYRPWYWTDEQIEARGLKPSLFPPLVEPGSIVGQLDEKAKQQLLLHGQSIPIIASGPDFSMVILGTACLEEGLVCDRAGSSEGLNYCTAQPPQGGNSPLRSLPHWPAGFFNTSAILPRTGKMFEDFRRSSGQLSRRYRDILADIDAATHISGSACSTLSCNPLAAAGRAVVENIGFMVREGVHQLEQAGYPVAELRLSGGQARNETWNQLKADILGRPLVTGHILDAELTGNAALCLSALGMSENAITGAKSIWRPGQRYEPNPLRADYYHRRWQERQETQWQS